MSNASLIHARLKSKGLNDYAICGILGNLEKESGLLPNNLQNTYNASLGLTDAQYTSKVDNGTYKNFATDSAGYGLAQWTYSTRKQNLLNYAKQQKVSIADLNMQTDFLYIELQSSYPALMKLLQNAKSVQEASDAFLLQFERPANAEAKKTERATAGMKWYTTLVGTTAAATPSTSTATTSTTTNYLVKVSISNLNIRSGPSTSYTSKGYITPGVYTIVEQQGTWGKLKSGVGWISLNYAKKL